MATKQARLAEMHERIKAKKERQTAMIENATEISAHLRGERIAQEEATRAGHVAASEERKAVIRSKKEEMHKTEAHTKWLAAGGAPDAFESEWPTIYHLILVEEAARPRTGRRISL